MHVAGFSQLIFMLVDQQKWTDEHAELPAGYLVYPSSKVSVFPQSILGQFTALSPNQTACLAVRQCVPKVTVCLKVINMMGLAQMLYWSLFKFVVWQYT